MTTETRLTQETEIDTVAFDRVVDAAARRWAARHPDASTEDQWSWRVWYEDKLDDVVTWLPDHAIVTRRLVDLLQQLRTKRFALADDADWVCDRATVDDLMAELSAVEGTGDE